MNLPYVSKESNPAKDAAKLPKEIKKRCDRGRSRMEQEATMRRLCIEFYNGNQYLFNDGKSLYDQRSGTVNKGDGANRNRHRVHQVRNLIKPIVDEKVSTASQRVPAYEVTPTTSDHEDIGAARLSEKVALAGFELWSIRPKVKSTVWYALVADEGFLYPYFDASVGPFVQETDEFGEPVGKPVGVGEIRIRSFGGNEAYWEPGVRFEDSRWHCIENARPKDEVEKDPDFQGGPLKPDAKERGQIASKASKSNAANSELVLVTEYFERPCPDYPEGRHLTVANDRLIFPEDTFPLRDEKGNVIDEPPFLRLAYTADPDSDRDQGIVRHLIDGNRTYNDSVNKSLEWMRLSMNPQIMAPAGSLKTTPTDAPGDIVYYDPAIAQMAGAVPTWRDTGSVPPEIFEIGDRAAADMRSISHANDITAGSVSSGSEVTQITENNQLAWSSFLSDLADLHGELMRRCLLLTQRHYSEPRLLKFKGRMGWETIDDFLGADIRGQTDVRVSVGSIEPRTRRAIEQKVMNLAQLFPGYFPPEVIMSALDGGNAEKLIDTYEQDVARVSAVIKKIRAGTLLDDGMRPVFPNEEFVDPEAIDPMTGQPLVDPVTMQPVNPFLEEVPAWLPRPFDGIPVHKATMEDWMKTQDYEALNDEGKEQAHQYYAALLDLESRAAQRDAELQMQQASDQGLENATRPPQEPQGGSAPALPE